MATHEADSGTQAQSRPSLSGTVAEKKTEIVLGKALELLVSEQPIKETQSMQETQRAAHLTLQNDASKSFQELISSSSAIYRVKRKGSSDKNEVLERQVLSNSHC